MAASALFSMVTSRLDPLAFFSSSNTTVAPYSYSLSNLSHDFTSEGNQDLAAHLLKYYFLAVLSSPLGVVEALAECQYQPSAQSDDLSEATDQQNLPMLQSGTWENIRDVVETETEGGWGALLKGHFTEFLFTISYDSVQPMLEESLNDLFDVYEDENVWTRCSSSAIVGALLSPLELVRVRLITQSSVQKTYYGPLHALHLIANVPNSSLLGALYPPEHLLPSVLIHFLSPLVRTLTLQYLAEEFGIDREFSPTVWHFCAVAAIGMECIITGPFELARKRLAIQKKREKRRLSRRDIYETSVAEAPQPQESNMYQTCVTPSPKQYSGVWDVISSVLSSEGGKARSSRRRRLRHTPRPSTPSRSGAESPSHRSSSLSQYNDWHKIDSAGLHDDSRYSVDPNTGLGAGSRRWYAAVKSLYRGFWARYAQKLVRYAVDEAGRGEDEW
ncbi:hypothetical protein HDU85_002222 [Gaertneriomyces sp. JEL0708]|nr:hypothetical protein HDU85_002222 [Gaertneriomyces sp. JEL0708]